MKRKTMQNVLEKYAYFVINRDGVQKFTSNDLRAVMLLYSDGFHLSFGSVHF